MTQRLPEAFHNEMKELWLQYSPEGSIDDFWLSLSQPAAAGLRANTLKIEPGQLDQLMGHPGFLPVPWAPTGFFVPDSMNPGRLGYYHAGLYYIQEPSAMLPAEILSAQPGERVLDLCAAPGGKATRLAAMVGEDGLLWANEISSDRVKALLRNLELMGVDRAVISNETPEKLAARLPAFFDRILVDAPCSGSGMFRRDPSAAASWLRYGPQACVPIQRDILESAHSLLRTGGHMVYSTCSFSLAEDEAMVLAFVQQHPEYDILPIEKHSRILAKDNPLVLSDGLAIEPALKATARLWPHLAEGDGHFCALLRKGPVDSSAPIPQTQSCERTMTGPVDPDLADAIQTFEQWAGQVLSEAGLAYLNRRTSRAYYRLHQGHLHLVPDCVSDLRGLRLVKTGLYLGQYRQLPTKGSRPDELFRRSARPKSIRSKASFEPAHALLLTLRSEHIRFALRLPADHPQLQRYLRGETVAWPEDLTGQLGPGQAWRENAWVGVCLENNPIGWARMTSPGQLKNLYPPAWRRAF